MASVTKITLPDGNTAYQVRWKTPARQSRKKNFALKRGADRHAAQVENAKATGGYIDRRDGQILLGPYAEQWAATQMWRSSSQVGIEGILTNYVIPTFGQRALASVRTTEVEVWVKNLSNDLAPGTVQNIHRVLAAVYRAAVRDHKVRPARV
jgi:hypothetical protein